MVENGSPVKILEVLELRWQQGHIEALNQKSLILQMTSAARGQHARSLPVVKV